MIAAIQAGGRSSRMGEDKAWLMLDGRPMIEHVLAGAQPVAERIVIVINQANPNLARYEQMAGRWQAKLLFDRHDHRGPLGGIETALAYSGAGKSALILACDLPFVTTAFLQLLHARHETEAADLTVPFDAEGHPQMLAAIYSAPCLPQVATLLAADELKARLLMTRVQTRCVQFAEYAHLVAADRLLRNVNTPGDYQKIIQP